MRINANIPAMQAHANLLRADRKSALAMQRLSSGVKINSVRDDPAGLSIAQKIKTQIQGLELASRNTLDGISITQTADGTLNEMQGMVQRMRELAVAAANDTITNEDRVKMHDELNQLRQEIDSVASRTEFNGVKLLDGSLSQLVDVKSNGVNIYGVISNAQLSADYPNASFDFTLSAVPLPPQVVGNLDLTDTFTAGKININGFEIAIEDGDSGHDVLGKIQQAADYLGFDVKHDAGGKLTITSGELGAGAAIDIKPGGALGQLGLSAGVTKGSDAVISNGTLTDAAGNAQAYSQTVSGNTVTIRAEDGRIMQFDLSVKAESDGTFKLGNGTVINADGSLAGGSIDLTLSSTDIGPMKINIGGNENTTMSINIPNVSAQSLGLNGINLKTREGAENAIDICDNANGFIAGVRARIGAYQNRLEHTAGSLESTAINMEASAGRIMDTDMAAEMTQLTQQNIISQAGMSILAQANQRPQQLLQLLS